MSFAKFGMFAAIASSNMLSVPLALCFLKVFGTPHVHVVSVVIVPLDPGLLMFGFYGLFSPCFRWSELGLSSQLFLPCVISTLIKIP